MAGSLLVAIACSSERDYSDAGTGGTGGTAGSGADAGDQSGGSAQGGDGGEPDREPHGGAGGEDTGAGGSQPGGAAGEAPAIAAGAGGEASVETAPTVVSVTPANDATGVAASTPVRITFSEPMDALSVESALTVSSLAAEDLQVSWSSSGKVMTIAPSDGWEYATGTALSTPAREYTVTIGTAARDAEGHALEEEFSSSFTALRRITQVIPADGAVSYSTYGSALGHDPVQCGSPTDTVFLNQWTTQGSGGTYHGFVTFALAVLGAPGASNVLEAATFTATQATSEAGFYTTHQVNLAKLAYRGLDKTLFSAAVENDFGLFVSSASTLNPSKDVLSAVKADFDAGKTSLLFKLVTTSGSADGFDAHFLCGGFSLTVTQLRP